jgi:predicted GTPase
MIPRIRHTLIWLLVLLIPCLILIPLGGIWLWEHNWLFYFGGGWLLLVVLIGIVMGWPHSLRQRVKASNGETATVEADTNWPPSASAAWHDVITLAESVSLKDLPLDNYNRMLQLGQQTVELVARHYFPESAKPLLQIDLGSLLRIVELVSRDLREEVTAKFPASHLIKIGWIPKAQRTLKVGQKAWQGYRIGSMIINPFHALTQAIRSYLLYEKLIAPIFDELQSWLLAWYVKKIGFYAIALYSGTLDKTDPTAKQTRYTRENLEEIEQRLQTIEAEPLRILVAGQVKSGKSSLINALFGELQAATDVLPCTSNITPYRLERNGIDLALVLDSPGYTEQQSGQFLWSKAWQNELLRADFILLVTSALQAARQADHQQLYAIREYFQTHLSRRMPPVIIVLSHIDQLRPVREWSPPYNVDNPQRLKERSIRGAMEAVANELGAALEDIIPVSLKTGDYYNVEEGLFTAIMARLNEAERVKYLRCLHDSQAKIKWSVLWEQLRHTGQIIVHLGKQAADR